MRERVRAHRWHIYRQLATTCRGGQGGHRALVAASRQRDLVKARARVRASVRVRARVRARASVRVRARREYVHADEGRSYRGDLREI